MLGELQKEDVREADVCCGHDCSYFQSGCRCQLSD